MSMFNPGGRDVGGRIQVWTPQIGPNEGDRWLEASVLQALGAAAGCWLPAPKGRLDQASVVTIGRGLIDFMAFNYQAAGVPVLGVRR